MVLLPFLGALLTAQAQSAPWQPSPGHTQLALWPSTPPDAPSAAPTPETLEVSTDKIAGRTIAAVMNVSRPTLTVYSPTGPKNTGAAVIVFPGGGYKGLAIDLEGTEVCDWLTPRGITCVVLKYRVPNSGPHWDDACKCELKPTAPTALQDAQRAIGLVRLHAKDWRIDPRKVGVLGFSAGGHLAADVSTHFDKRAYLPIDAADRESSRPDFAVLLYPGHLSQDPRPHELNPDIRPTRATPPTFIVQAEDDPVDRVENSRVYCAALRKAGAPVEMHLYPKGGHAFGLRRTDAEITAWPAVAEKWLASLGVIPSSSAAERGAGGYLLPRLRLRRRLPPPRSGGG